LVDRVGTTVGQSLDVRFTPFYPRSNSTVPTSSPTVAADPPASPTQGPENEGPTENPVIVGTNVEVVVRIVLDGFPQETGWSIVAMNGTTIVSVPVGTYALPQTEVFEAVILLSGTMYNFTLIDFFADGMSGGSWEILQDDVAVVSGSGSNFSSSVTVPFTTSTPLNATAVPTALIDSVNVTILILFDDFPDEIGWSITQNSTDEEIISVPIGTYPLLTEIGTETVSLIPGEWYEFTIEDFFGDGLTARGQAELGGYMILQDVEGDTITLVMGGPDFGFNETTVFSPVLL
jgi:hypothetical protein